MTPVTFNSPLAASLDLKLLVVFDAVMRKGGLTVAGDSLQ